MSKQKIMVKFLERISVQEEGDNTYEQTFVVQLENGLKMPIEDNSIIGSNKLIGKNAIIKLNISFTKLKKIKRAKMLIVTRKNFIKSKSPESTNVFYGKIAKFLKNYYGLKAIHLDVGIAKLIVMLDAHTTVFKYPQLKEGDYIKVRGVTQLDEIVKILE